MDEKTRTRVCSSFLGSFLAHSLQVIGELSADSRFTCVRSRHVLGCNISASSLLVFCKFPARSRQVLRKWSAGSLLVVGLVLGRALQVGGLR